MYIFPPLADRLQNARSNSCFFARTMLQPEHVSSICCWFFMLQITFAEEGSGWCGGGGGPLLGQVKNAKQMLLMRWKMQTKRSAKFNKTADKPFVFESQLQASSDGEGEGGEGRQGESWGL